MDEFIDGVQMGDFEKMSHYFGTIGYNPTSPAYVYSIRYALNVKDHEMLKYLLQIAPLAHKFDPDTIAASVMTMNPLMFKDMIGHTAVGLQNTFTVHNHPLVIASRIGNVEVAKFIIEWIRKTNARYVENADAIKTMSLKMAARGGHVAIANMLITKPQHAHDIIAGLITNGHVDAVQRFSAHQLVDFTANNFELMRLCAPYPKILNQIMRHPSLVNVDMPTLYSLIAKEAAENHFHYTVDLVEESFKQKLTFLANTKVQATGCSVKDAVTETYIDLKGKHKNHMAHPSLTQFSF